MIGGLDIEVGSFATVVTPTIAALNPDAAIQPGVDLTVHQDFMCWCVAQWFPVVAFGSELK